MNNQSGRSALLVEQAREPLLELVSTQPPLVERLQQQLHEATQRHRTPSEAGHQMHQRLDPVVAALRRLDAGEVTRAGIRSRAGDLENQQTVDSAQQTAGDHLSGEV